MKIPDVLYVRTKPTPVSPYTDPAVKPMTMNGRKLCTTHPSTRHTQHQPTPSHTHTQPNQPPTLAAVIGRTLHPYLLPLATPATGAAAAELDDWLAEPVDAWLAEPIDAWLAEPVDAWLVDGLPDVVGLLDDVLRLDEQATGTTAAARAQRTRFNRRNSCIPSPRVLAYASR